MPISFFPVAESDYNYSFSADIKAESPIVYVSSPDNTEVKRDPSNPHLVSLTKTPESGLELEKDLVIYYKTANMEAPVLLAQKSTSNPDEVAVMMSFIPSFQEQNGGTVAELETVQEEKPEP